MKAVTQWFTADDRPVHIGCYQSCREEVNPDNHFCLTYWDGKLWRWLPTGAICEIQNCNWRGLADKSEHRL